MGLVCTYLGTVLDAGKFRVSTESKTLLDSHIAGRSRFLGKSSSGDLLHASGRGPSGGQGGSLRGLGSQIAVETGSVGFGRDVE
jgi:hypothetical protein